MSEYKISWIKTIGSTRNTFDSEENAAPPTLSLILHERLGIILTSIFLEFYLLYKEPLIQRVFSVQI